MPRRFLSLCLLALALCTSRGAAATADSTLVWRFEGENLRRLHAETLEDLLREVPLLRVERRGAAGLPYRVYAGAGRGQELMLVVDGQPWRDPWSGESLREELPLALVESVIVDLRPDLTRYGAGARAGTVSVRTRTPAEPKVSTRLHVSRGTYGERGRKLRFVTPPGDVALSVGLDEFFGGDYPFSGVWNGEDDFQPATPEVSFSQRRNLSLALHLDAGAAGPLVLRLHQSDWHLDRELGATDPWYRERTRFELALPATPLGELAISQELLERSHRAGRASDAALRMRIERTLPRLGDARLLAGFERHQLGFASGNNRQDLPRPAMAWAAGRWAGELPGGLRLGLGLRGEHEFDLGSRVMGELGLGLPLGGGFRLDATLTQGEGAEPWGRQRLPDLGLWPDGLGAPGSMGEAAPNRRGQLALSRRGERFWATVLAARQDGGRDWLAVADDEDRYHWVASEGEPRHALGLELGARFTGRQGEARARLAAQAELEDPLGRQEDRAYSPLYARGELSLARPFFASDARLQLEGALEFRGGRDDHRDMLRSDVGVELRVLAARFWLQLRNSLEWSGEESPGFPVPPGTLRLGVDWQLDH